jgi:hypothetical protein
VTFEKKPFPIFNPFFSRGPRLASFCLVQDRSSRAWLRSRVFPPRGTTAAAHHTSQWTRAQFYTSRVLAPCANEARRFYLYEKSLIISEFKRAAIETRAVGPANLTKEPDIRMAFWMDNLQRILVFFFFLRSPPLTSPDPVCVAPGLFLPPEYSMGLFTSSLSAEL